MANANGQSLPRLTQNFEPPPVMPNNDSSPPDPTDTRHAPDSSPTGGVRALATLAALASANALWAVFLWRELIRARAGETPFCGFGESADCGTLWSASFAGTIHNMTGVPVAGWGLVWALVAALLPLFALATKHKSRQVAACTAIELTAVAGVAGIVALLAASAAEGLFCTSCALTYVLTLAYAAVTLFALNRPVPRSSQGLALAAAGTIGCYLLLLYPGLKTPKSATEEGQRALAGAAHQVEQAGASSAAMAEGRSQARSDGGGPAGAVDLDRRLEEFVASLKPRTRQDLSDTLFVNRNGRQHAVEPPRLLALGAPGARVEIAEFTDILCSHCATLHHTMTQLSNLLPPGSFNLDARHFPLDGRCNQHLTPRDGDDVRCMAAKTLICVEDTGWSFELSGTLFEHQRGLTSEQVYELAAPFIDRDQLTPCLSSEATAAKLASDVDYAWHYEPHGTPLVLINGREGNPFPPFLYAIILAGGDPDHAAFASLPTPNPPQPHDHEH